MPRRRALPAGRREDPDVTARRTPFFPRGRSQTKKPEPLAIRSPVDHTQEQAWGGGGLRAAGPQKPSSRGVLQCPGTGLDLLPRIVVNGPGSELPVTLLGIGTHRITRSLLSLPRTAPSRPRRNGSNRPDHQVYRRPAMAFVPPWVPPRNGKREAASRLAFACEASLGDQSTVLGRQPGSERQVVSSHRSPAARPRRRLAVGHPMYSVCEEPSWENRSTAVIEAQQPRGATGAQQTSRGPARARGPQPMRQRFLITRKYL